MSRQPVTPELRIRVSALLRSGRSYGEIARAIGRSKNAVAGILQRVRNPRPVRTIRPDLDISLVSDLPIHEARYILAVTFGLGLSETARMVGRTPPTVRYSCHRVEDRRDDPEYDEHITRLEIAKLREATESTTKPTGTSLAQNTPKRRRAREYISRVARRRRPRVNNARDPEVRKLIDQISLSGLTDKAVAELAGINRKTIQGWREGRKPTPFFMECVREVLKKNTPGY